MFGRLKDWHHVATRYDRSAKTFLSQSPSQQPFYSGSINEMP
jgi:hypothetical protein